MKQTSLNSKIYKAFSIVIVALLAFLFLFPLYWIVTGAFKPQADIYAQKPVWFPTQWASRNFQKLFERRSAPLFDIFGIEGPVSPAVFRWLVNTVFMAVMAMILTCLVASMAGYALAKKHFRGRNVLFALIIAAMALPKQVILIPLLREMSALKLYGTLWAVIFPTVGWPFGVFLMKQFSQGIPDEILEAARVDGSSELRTFSTIVFPMIKPGVGALAIFTFITSWNDYFMQLIMLNSNDFYTISLGIATLQAETTVDSGILMAGATLASVPIIIVFLLFQKYFTRGITMGALKG